MASRLASAVAQRAKQEGLKLTNKQADLLVKEVLESIKADLKATGTARLPGLGSLKARAARFAPAPSPAKATLYLRQRFNLSSFNSKSNFT